MNKKLWLVSSFSYNKLMHLAPIKKVQSRSKRVLLLTYNLALLINPSEGFYGIFDQYKFTFYTKWQNKLILVTLGTDV